MASFYQLQVLDDTGYRTIGFFETREEVDALFASHEKAGTSITGEKDIEEIRVVQCVWGLNESKFLYRIARERLLDDTRKNYKWRRTKIRFS